jgi:hypothetical protein
MATAGASSSGKASPNNTTATTRPTRAINKIVSRRGDRSRGVVVGAAPRVDGVFSSSHSTRIDVANGGLLLRRVPGSDPRYLQHRSGALSALSVDQPRRRLSQTSADWGRSRGTARGPRPHAHRGQLCPRRQATDHGPGVGSPRPAAPCPGRVPKPRLLPLSCGLDCAFVFVEQATQDGPAHDPSMGKVLGGMIRAGRRSWRARWGRRPL